MATELAKGLQALVSSTAEMQKVVDAMEKLSEYVDLRFEGRLLVEEQVLNSDCFSIYPRDNISRVLELVVDEKQGTDKTKILVTRSTPDSIALTIENKGYIVRYACPVKGR